MDVERGATGCFLLTVLIQAIVIVAIVIGVISLVRTGIYKVEKLTECQKESGTYYFIDDSCVK